MATAIFTVKADSFDGTPAVRVEGAGDIPLSPLQSETFANDEWTAWYPVAGFRDRIERMACGCYGCDERVQDGHFSCSSPSPFLLALEERGNISRSYDGGAWRWAWHGFVRASKSMPLL